jgi:sugar-specific transcriptional regulator TrmB/DNA-binding CsgD family transcriptional regulator
VSLRQLGFSPLQERIYLHLVRRPATTLEALPEVVGAEPIEVRAALDHLIDVGVLRLGPDGLVVLRPSFALGKLIERIEDEIMTRYRQVADVRSEVATLEAAYSEDPVGPADSPMIERIEEISAVRERVEELSFFTRESLDSIQPGGPQSREAIEASRPLDQRALRRGIAMRLIHDREVLSDEVNRAHLYELLAAGIPVRITDLHVERLLVFDRRTALVPIEPNGSRRGALLVRQPSLVSGLIDLFERVWADAEPLRLDDVPAVVAAEQDGPSELDRQVLAMLAAGATDATIAKELGMSVRHLGRRISRILTLLGADSRFRAGVEAQRRGWIQ